jgi:hypothetical protein
MQLLVLRVEEADGTLPSVPVKYHTEPIYSLIPIVQFVLFLYHHAHLQLFVAQNSIATKGRDTKHLRRAKH